MEISTAEITGVLGQYMWPFIRIAAMIMVAPIFSSNFLSARTRIIIALAISIVLVPNIPANVPTVEPLSMEGFLIIAQQILIGACMGFMLQLLFNAFIVAGQIIAMQMGLGFASMVDPQNGVLVPVISQFYLIFITLLFITVDGHLILIKVLSESFVTMPISSSGLTPTDLRDVVAQLPADEVDGAGTRHLESTQVRNVEHTRRAPHRCVLVDDTGVMKRHGPAAEIGETGAHLVMDGVDW